MHMNLQKVVIIGAGGSAREILDVFDAFNQIQPTYNVLGFIVDPEYGNPGTCILDKPILGGFDWFTEQNDDIKAICGVGLPELRLLFVNRAQKMGIRFISIIHPNAILTRRVTIGEDTVITAGCILTNQIRIGDHVHINTSCTIAHDVVIDDFVTLSPGVNIAGNVSLNQGCYIGIGATVIEKMNIGSWSIVGAGATVISNVPRNTTVVGTPNKIIETRQEGWQHK
jgi:sugar O-acyltransferase (sialic acid O-acetyltransferase NeuD family)